MTEELAARWAGTVVPSWIYRWLLPLAWFGAISASLITDVAPCSVDDPTICGPDRTFSLAMTACFAALVLAWWQPTVAAVAGLLFMVLELLYDDVTGARIAWTAYGVLCAVLLTWAFMSRRRQRSLAAAAPRRPVQVPAAASVGLTGRLLVAGALVLVGAAALGVMRWQDHREQVHVGRAVEQTAVSNGVNSDGDLVLRLAGGQTHKISVIGDYSAGTEVPILVDPADPQWIRLRAELADNTYWYTVALGAGILALLFVLRDRRLRGTYLRTSWSGQGLPVRIEPDASSAFAIRSADNAVLLGFLDTRLDDEDSDVRLMDAFSALDDDEDEVPAKLKREWAKTLRRYRGEALLVGDLVEGSWPTILYGDQVLRPLSPFRAPRRLPWRTEKAEGLSGEVEPPAERAPEPAQAVPTLPWQVPLEPAPWWTRPVLGVLLVAGPVAAGVLASWDEWFGAFLAVVIGAQLVYWLGMQVFYRVIATATDLWIRGSLLERRVPWRSFDAVEVEDDGVSLQTGDDYHQIGGIAKNEQAKVAAVFETLRLRARTGLPDQQAMRRPAPILLVNAVFVAVCALVLVLVRWGPF
ncbi:hypothetical protein [Kribbella sp.]|uniref:hypothetical protein n=1 Tax=Kribbella sp. TaxID=1871183 RepID=UPI002D59EC34|nr:hypothetical protein [Kribbella sp.]HZX06052.1 hypothetical protein [Kribbella sp.]